MKLHRGRLIDHVLIRATDLVASPRCSLALPTETSAASVEIVRGDAS